MKIYKEDLIKRQHKIAKKVEFNVGNSVMVKLHTPLASNKKLSPNFTGPYKIV